jgi:hypothetical protein
VLLNDDFVADCSFGVIVRDIEAPTVECPATVNVFNDNNVCGAVVNAAARSHDNCGNEIVSVDGIEPGSLFPVGTTSNVVSVVDASGNIGG